MIRVKILNYGSGNIGSMQSAFQKIGINLTQAKTEEDIVNCDLLVLPGVGSAKTVIKTINDSKIIDFLNKRNLLKKPTLGVCLGAQIFFDYLEEANSSGFGWLEGSVNSFKEKPLFNNGWCHIEWNSFKKIGLSRGLLESNTFYFNHQYHLPNNKNSNIVTIKELPNVPAIYIDGHNCGFQFHPEKSQRAGTIILRNLIKDYYGL
jgi:glutamine amidotransferase